MNPHESRFSPMARALSGPELAELIGILSRDHDENWAPEELLGVCLEEAVRRLKNPEGETQE